MSKYIIIGNESNNVKLVLSQPVIICLKVKAYYVHNVVTRV